VLLKVNKNVIVRKVFIRATRSKRTAEMTWGETAATQAKGKDNVIRK
jgi:predicted nuclease of restriction endonuclease-like (RecB) superfamily